MTFLELVARALAERRATAALNVAATALAVMLLMVMLGLRRAALHQLDAIHRAPPLVVGRGAAPSSLVLATVLFVDERVGIVPATVVEELRAHPSVRSVLPVSLGDSFRGHPIVATDPDAFSPAFGLVGEAPFDHGRAFGEGGHQAVVGADVARAFDLRVGDRIEPSHGGGDEAAGHGEEHLFDVVGVLRSSGTPIDDVVLVPRATFDELPGHVEHGSVSAILVVPKGGMHLAVLQAELAKRGDVVVAETHREVTRLRARFGAVDGVLGIVCALGLVVAWLGSLASGWAVARTRLREMALLRHVGAGRTYVAGLLVAESTLIAMAGGLVGLLLSVLFIATGGAILDEHTGLQPIATVTVVELAVLLAVTLGGVVAGLLPAAEVHRRDVIQRMRGET